MSKKHYCCSFCDGPNEKRDFKGYHPEDEEDAPYRRKRGKGRACKRSKDGQHDWTGKRVGMGWRDKRVDVQSEDGSWHRESRRVYVEVTYTVCAKCTKPQRWSWRYW